MTTTRTAGKFAKLLVVAFGISGITVVLADDAKKPADTTASTTTGSPVEPSNNGPGESSAQATGHLKPKPKGDPGNPANQADERPQTDAGTGLGGPGGPKMPQTPSQPDGPKKACPRGRTCS